MPIYEEKGLFRLDTEDSSYWLRVSPFGHLEHLHYGAKLGEGDGAPLAVKRSVPYGSAVCYSESDATYCLDTLCKISEGAIHAISLCSSNVGTPLLIVELNNVKWTLISGYS